MTTEDLVSIGALSLVAEIAGTIGGFGSSVFFVPLAGFFLDFHSVLGVTALFHLSGNLSKIALFRKGINRKLVLLIGIPAIISVLIGAWLSKFVSSGYLELGLSLFLVFISLLFLLNKNFSVKPQAKTCIGGGIVSGFIAGLIGTGGAIRGLVLASFNLEMEVFIASSALIDLGIDASRSIVYFQNGYIGQEEMILLPVLIVSGFAGTWVGKKILEKLTDGQFKTLVLWMILVTGLLTGLKYLLD